jgi:ADP-ribosylglycohydrolase
MPTSIAERAAGCLVVQALGDALGFMVEGQGPQVCTPYAFEDIPEGRCLAYRRGPFAFGQYSDDTQLARELLQSVAAAGRFDPALYALRIAGIFQERRIVGRGRATEAAARRLIDCTPWMASVCPAPNAGNGSAMRAAPIGILFAHDPIALAPAARDQSWITHQDPRCVAGSIVIAGATATLLTSHALDVAGLLAALSAAASAADPVLADALSRRMPEWLDRPWQDAAAEIAVVGRAEDDGWPGISPFVTGSVLWSLYAFLRHPDDQLAAIALAIAPGGDVDTTAAMCGALAGAYRGTAGLPEDLIGALNDAGHWRASALGALASDCYTDPIA